MNNLKTVISLLKSDKTKDRQQGITSLREVFGRPQVIERLDEKGDGRAWLVVFQALFNTVISEREVAVKSGASAAAAERRLKDAASAVRWLTEKSVQQWTMKVGKALVKHILQAMVHGSRLLVPLALDYIKALRVVCAYAPHLEHLVADERQWLNILSLGFAILLDDDLKRDLEDEDFDLSEAEVNSAPSTDEELTSRKRKKRDTRLKNPYKAGQQRTASPEQIEMIALIATLLQLSGANIVSSRYPRLPSAICKRLVRFFRHYPMETSAHLDAIGAIQAVLGHLALNARDEMIAFSANLWNHLLQLWSTKSKPLRERILVVLKALLPFVIHPDSPLDRADALGKLLRVLRADHEVRWGFEELSLDSMRLEVSLNSRQDAFVANTFRSGFNFSASQATAWVVLELTSDATKELYLFSESAHSLDPNVGRHEGKRAKLENPIALLVQALQHVDILGRLSALQGLLFLVDRHWSTVHSELQTEVVHVLLQLITADDVTIQNWVFCCFAAITHADSLSASNGSINWDAMWNHAIRRTNVPLVSRTACHSAHMLLLSRKVTQIRIHAEIGAMIQDIDVQGPPAPYDSVCAFLSRCIDVAVHDTHLYRMHLDEKVLSWFIENWSITGKGSRTGTNFKQFLLDQYTLNDLLQILEHACGLSISSTIRCSNHLPQHPLVYFIEEQLDISVMREYLLNACFPQEEKPENRSLGSWEKSSQPSGELAQPDARARKVSAFFLKALEGILTEWHDNMDNTLRSSVEYIRRLLDLAVLSICYESSLVLNGISNNRRTIIAACKLVSLISPRLLDLIWTPEELDILLASLAPLVGTGAFIKKTRKWEAFVEPGQYTGVRNAQPEIGDRVNPRGLSPESGRQSLHSTIWQSADVQDALWTVLDTLKQLLKLVTTNYEGQTSKHLSPVIEDDQDGFAPMRLNDTPAIDVARELNEGDTTRRIVSICIDFLVLAPALRSTDDGTVKDRALTDLICECENDEAFLQALEPFLWHTQRRNFRLSISDLDKLLTRIEGPLMSYRYGNSDLLHVTTIHLLNATSYVWIQAAPSSDTSGKVYTLVKWLSDKLKEGRFICWRTRDSLCRFLEEYIRLDPTQRFLTDEKGVLMDGSDSPDTLIPLLLKDGDMRVRFTAARASSSLFSTEYIRSKDPMIVYTSVREHLCVDLSDYENMLTRFLCLANIMIASSAVRRGPYWHLLETCLHSSSYVKPIENVLTAVSAKMGLNRLSELFEVYASQIAYSIRISQQDFFRFPPHLLGYRDRRECAEATFTAFSPSNLLVGPQDTELLGQGQGAFDRHCQLTNRTSAEGLTKCFSDIAGYRIIFWMDDHQKLVGENSQEAHGELWNFLLETFKQLGSAAFVERLIKQNIEGIVYVILRTTGDLDHHKEGTIITGIEALNKPERAIRAFKALMQFQSRGNFEVHPPNLPAFSIQVVLSALTWLASRFQDVNTQAITYHVMQRLFADAARFPLINEQLRCLISLCIWISLQYPHFVDPTLLKILMNGAVNLLEQPELACIAQGMLNWAFIHLRETKSDTPHFVRILIRICSVTQQFSTSSNDHVKALGSRIKAWIGNQMVALQEVEPLRKRIAVALTVWPDTLAGFSESEDDLSGETLSRILDDPYLGPYKFKVSRRLAALSQEMQSTDRFARHDFWRLKDSIPMTLETKDVDAFADLLFANSGRVNSQIIDKSYNRSIGARYLRHIMQKDDQGKRNVNVSIKRSVVNALLDMLSNSSAQVAYEAYRTLRLLAGIEPLDSLEYGSWSSEYHGDVTFLSSYATKEDGGIAPNLVDLLQSRLLEVASNYRSWISELSVFLTNVLSTSDPFYGHLSKMLSDNTDFAEQIFPVLVHTLLKQASNPLDSEPRKIVSEYLARLLARPDLDSRCHRSVVTLVLHLRNLIPAQFKSALDYNRWLDLDFVLLGRSAIKCGAYTTALLFLELATEYKQAECSSVPKEEILYDIYNHIDEPDGFYGIKAHDLKDFLLRRFHHEKQWDKAFQFHGAGLEAGNKPASDALGILQSLHSFGFNEQAMSALQSMSDTVSSSQSSDMEYTLGWRISAWDLPTSETCRTSNYTLYTALKAVHRERDNIIVDNIVSKCFADELLRLRELGNENLAEVRQINQCLMCLRQVSQWRSSPVQADLSSGRISRDSIYWKEFGSLQDDLDFPDAEAVVATRLSLLRSARHREQRDQIGVLQSDLTQALVETQQRCLIRLSEAAREARQPQIALNSILCAMQLQPESQIELRKELASVLWVQKEQKAAIECLKLGLPSLGEVAHIQQALTLAKLGEWTNEACLEKPDYIQDAYFTPAIEQLQKAEDTILLRQHRADVFYKYALFAEQQYHSITRSPDLVRLKVYSERKRQELEDREDALRRTSSNSAQFRELTQYQRKAKALYEQDTAQFIEVIGARDKYLKQAIEMLSLSMEAFDSYDVEASTRLCSLWLAHFASELLGQSISDAVARVPSRKFVFLAHQLSARLSASESSLTKNQALLQSLLLRMCSEHPFHSLYQVYSLQSSDPGGTSPRRRSIANEPQDSQLDRAAAAEGILQQLLSSTARARQAKDVKLLCDAYLEWAKFPIKKDPSFSDKRNRKAPPEIPKSLAIRKITNIRVPVTTADTPLDPSMRYEDCVWIVNYIPYFETAGGINLPKISYCLGSNGVKYKQLFKGEGDDDLRQDAVMEQVFALCNQILSRDRETRKRTLSIRSYKVIPLAPQAGLLEFVGNTQPMQHWLKEAHERYHPGNLRSRDCSSRLISVRNQFEGSDTAAQKAALVKVFQNIRQKFRPVLRHFFTEQHKVPQSWFEMRLNYSRSVAVTSIVGHVLGLGDRHISNILLDTASGEVVHIDLGIAFNQGKLLPIAERVPFRLTADMVDGFGMSGTEGVFRRCAEETLRVLRDGSDIIKTVLEVFRYDPLHSWTASAVKIKRAQGDSASAAAMNESDRLGIGIDMSSGSEDEAADRALNGVAMKLDKTLSVEYTVNELITEATDVTNLALMFAGWSPFC